MCVATAPHGVAAFRSLCVFDAGVSVNLNTLSHGAIPRVGSRLRFVAMSLVRGRVCASANIGYESAARWGGGLMVRQPRERVPRGGGGGVGPYPPTHRRAPPCQDISKIPEFCVGGGSAVLTDLQNLEKMCKLVLQGKNESWSATWQSTNELAPRLATPRPHPTIVATYVASGDRHVSRLIVATSLTLGVVSGRCGVAPGEGGGEWRRSARRRTRSSSWTPCSGASPTSEAASARSWGLGRSRWDLDSIDTHRRQCGHQLPIATRMRDY